MKKLLSFWLILISISFSQSLVQTVPLPTGTYWASAYGLAYGNGKYWISSAASTLGRGLLYAVDENGVIVDSLQVQNYPALNASQGLAFDGTNFWYVERKTARCDLFKISPQGVVLDSIPIAQAGGTTSWYLGGAAWDGTGLWVSVYYPDDKAGMYKINVATKTFVDTIKVIAGQLQPTGVTIKGDTLFWVNDGFQGVDKIYAVSMTTKDTLFSFNPPEQPGLRQNPRGLAWDGNHFWLMAEPVGASSGRSLFKYDLGGSGTPSINLITTNIQFGNVQIDSTRNANIYIQNFGTANLVLDSIVVSGSAFTVSGNYPLTIAPGVTHTLTASFKPNIYGAYRDSVLFYHNDPNFVFSKTVFLGNGIYTSPFISFSDNVLNYGDKRINSTSYKTLTISNLGSEKLYIDSMTIGTEYFYLINYNFPITVDSVKNTSVNVWFHPTALTNYLDTLKIYTNASNNPVYNMVLNGTGSSFNATLGNIVWQGMIPDNPSTSFQDKSAKFFRRINDLNGDGIDDIIVGTENYYTIAYNGNSSGSADILWRFSSYRGNANAGSIMRQQGLQVISDINGDGIDDVIIGTGGGNEFVYAIDGKTGAELWAFGDSINYNNGDINGLDVKRDWNNDGIPDVLVSASGNESTGQGRFSVYLLNGVTGQQIWQLNQASQQKMKDAIASTDDGGAVGSRAAGSTPGEVTGFNKQGQLAWAFPTSGGVWGLVEIQDIGGAPTTDLIAGTTNGNVYAVTGDAGVQIWTRNLGSAFIEDLYIIPDINRSGVDDIIVSALTPWWYVLEGRTGEIILSGITENNNLGAGVLGDLNADTLNEFGITSLDGKVYIYTSKNGALLFTYTTGGTNSLVPENVWQMGDLDQNGTLEFIVGTRDGRLFAFSGGTDVIIGVTPEGFVPGEFVLHQNYPNPFNPSTNIKFDVPKLSKISLKIFDVLGREIKTLVNEEMNPGVYRVEWNGLNNEMNKVSSGIYFVRLEADDFVSSKKMIFLK